jgi:hypothetical protein
MEQLTREQWAALASAHAARVDDATRGHRERRRLRPEDRAHPVEDFLFTYYSHRPAQLRRWHPGRGVALEDAAERASWKHYVYDGSVASLDLPGFLAARGDAVRFIHRLLVATSGRSAHLGCFGLHEWAMVHRLDADRVRHSGWPLRLSPRETDAVVEAHQVKCSHFDAFRFFTPTARPLNTVAPQRNTQTEMEQPGCLHANMDLYKWAYKLTPAVPSELVMDCFDLAREVRELDMRAAPYDLSELGYEPVRIETTAGKAEYVAAQRGFAERAQALRRRLIAACDALLAPHRENNQRTGTS